VAEQPHNPAPIVGQPIAAPHTPPVSENIAVAGPTSPQEKQKARNEVNRLQSEIDGLQNHIAQLTQAIQAHPKAQQRGQWDNERNADRTNIDGKRNEITWWNARA
jgi:outer membrane murein-binding lipoprotein Lpp